MARARASMIHLLLFPALILAPTAHGEPNSGKYLSYEWVANSPKIPGWAKGAFAVCAAGAICTTAYLRSLPDEADSDRVSAEEASTFVIPAKPVENEQFKSFMIQERKDGEEGPDAWPITERFLTPQELKPWLIQIQDEFVAGQVYGALFAEPNAGILTSAYALRVHPKLRVLASRNEKGEAILTLITGGKGSTDFGNWHFVDSIDGIRDREDLPPARLVLLRLSEKVSALKPDPRDRYEAIEKYLDSDYSDRAIPTPDAVKAKAAEARPKYPSKSAKPTIHRVEFLGPR